MSRRIITTNIATPIVTVNPKGQLRVNRETVKQIGIPPTEFPEHLFVGVRHGDLIVSPERTALGIDHVQMCKASKHFSSEGVFNSFTMSLGRIIRDLAVEELRYVHAMVEKFGDGTSNQFVLVVYVDREISYNPLTRQVLNEDQPVAVDVEEDEEEPTKFVLLKIRNGVASIVPPGSYAIWFGPREGELAEAKWAPHEPPHDQKASTSTIECPEDEFSTENPWELIRS